MLRFSARSFFWIGYLLEHLQNDCLISSHIGDGDDPVYNLMAPIDERTRTKAIKSLTGIEEDCARIGLAISAETVAELRRYLSDDLRDDNSQWFMDQIRSVRKLIEKEMKGKVFIYMSPERARFLPSSPNPFVFGKEVHENFPSVQYDCAEAACSLAFLRPTACVFHLMRVMEIALCALGATFGISLAHTNWGPAVDQIESAIRNMHKSSAWKAQPDCKELQEGYSQAISTFGVLKDAWRNYTMHARGRYTEEEAEHLYNNTRFFMQKLVVLGLKESC